MCWQADAGSRVKRSDRSKAIIIIIIIIIIIVVVVVVVVVVVIITLFTHCFLCGCDEGRQVFVMLQDCQVVMHANV